MILILVVYASQKSAKDNGNNCLYSVVLLHRDERRDVSSANRAGLLRLDKLFATVLADAEMAAGHYEGVLRVTEADEALGIGVVVFDRLMAFLSLAIIGRHSINGF